MTRKADVGRARLGNAPMPAADVLRQYVGWLITDVKPRPTGVVLEMKLPGRTYNPPRRLLLKDVTRVDWLPDPKPRDDDDGWTQLQMDIGDEIYERQRYDEADMDVEPDRTATKGPEPI